jgi:UDP-hydrolysing UDP-N-acetyl-D-glucosamine 2-epimerase
VVVTARPSWARVKSIVLNYAESFGHELIKITLAGSSISRNFGDISNQIPHEISWKPLHTLQDSDDLTSVSLSAFNLSSALVRAWASDRPDIVMVIADRTETLGVSAAAAISQIPLVHLQGGEFSGSIDNKIRDANSKLADLHLTTNETTKQRLIQLGENANLIHAIGCPSIDLVRQTLDLGESYEVQDVPGVGVDIKEQHEFGIVMFHPDTINEKENSEWLNVIIEFVEQSDLSWLWFWPNPDHGTIGISKELRRRRESGGLQNTRFVINVKPEMFISIASKARMIIGNSSFGIREASYLGLPSLNLGKRQMNRQKSGNVLNIENLSELGSIQRIFSPEFRFEIGQDLTYGDGHAGEAASRIIGNWNPILKI